MQYQAFGGLYLPLFFSKTWEVQEEAAFYKSMPQISKMWKRITPLMRKLHLTRILNTQKQAMNGFRQNF